MDISPKLRFSVFQRDDFTCRYCGRTTPEVILEADHIIPRAEGGGDEPENLTTSCFECNRGKGKTLLTTDIEDADIHEKTVLLAEREMQLRENQELAKHVREREDAEIKTLQSHWASLHSDWKYHPQPIFESALRWGLKSFSFYDLCEMMEYSADKFNRNSALRSRKYFLVVMRNNIEGKGSWNARIR